MAWRWLRASGSGFYKNVADLVRKGLANKAPDVHRREQPFVGNAILTIGEVLDELEKNK